MVHVASPGPNLGATLGQALGNVALGLYQRHQQNEQQNQLRQSLAQARHAYEDPNLSEPQKIFGLYQALQSNPGLAKDIASQIYTSQSRNPTPYQEANLEHRKRHLELQEQRLAQAKEKKHQQMPELVSRYTKTYLQGSNFDPSDKIELDKFVQNAFETQNIPLQDALQQGLESISMKKEMLAEAPIIERPAKDEIPLAMDEMIDILRDLYAKGIKNRKELAKVAMRGKWKKPEIEMMLDNVFTQERPVKEPAKTPKPKVKFDPSNPEHVAKARQALQKAGGDKEKANAILFEEFTK